MRFIRILPNYRLLSEDITTDEEKKRQDATQIEIFDKITGINILCKEMQIVANDSKSNDYGVQEIVESDDNYTIIMEHPKEKEKVRISIIPKGEVIQISFYQDRQEFNKKRIKRTLEMPPSSNRTFELPQDLSPHTFKNKDLSVRLSTSQQQHQGASPVTRATETGEEFIEEEEEK